MFAGVVLLQLALWTLFASAFYPYTPRWLKEKEELDLLGEAKRNIGVPEDGLTFKLEKKARQVSDSGGSNT